jgi:enoyl-[acyl-carrier protein] reductase I
MENIMFAIDLSKKTALVTGVADNIGFGWHIAKALANAGAEIILSSHPRVISILDRFLTKDKYLDSRRLLNGGFLTPKDVIPCDVSLDSMSELDPALKNEKGYEERDVSIDGLVKSLSSKHVDILVHSVAFSPEIDRLHLSVSRKAYLMAMSVSSYSLVALCRALLPNMQGRQASVMALSYLASERAVPFYGGGMASAKAALECDARMLAWQLGEYGHRINIISAGPYASRAAKSIGDIDAVVEKTKNKSPLRSAISPEDVANLALFLASDLSRMITAETIHVDAGFHAMALV